MKSRIALVVSLAALASSLYAADFTDLAPVISSTPIYERVNAPRQECWNETVTTHRYRRDRSSGVGALIGGIAGGIIGHQVGKGTGKDVATAVGAVTGAIVGDRIDNQDEGYYESRPRSVQRCRTVDDYREEIRGYNVIYRYAGRDITARLPYDPGPHVRIAIGVIDQGRYSSNTYR